MNSETQDEISPSGMLGDIFDTPEVLRTLYRNYVEHNHPALKEAADLLARSQPVIMTGMVTSEFGAYPASILLNQAGRANFIFEAAELLHYHQPVLRPPSCLVAISQSGESAEIVHLLDAINRDVPVVGVYNNEDSYLAHHSDIGLPLYTGVQHACGTKTNIATVATLLLLVEATLSGDRKASGKPLLKLADSIERLLINWEDGLSGAAEFLADAQDLIFLGRGPGLSSARFSAVLFREVTKSVAEGLSAAAFRHGLLEMIRPEHRVVIFAPAGSTHELCLGIAAQLLEYGVPVMLVTNREVDLRSDKGLYILSTDPCDEYYSPILDMLPLQLIGYQLARWKGLVPGKLTLTSYVTRIE